MHARVCAEVQIAGGRRQRRREQQLQLWTEPTAARSRCAASICVCVEFYRNHLAWECVGKCTAYHLAIVVAALRVAAVFMNGGGKWAAVAG